jgi:hypothetical protein
MRVSGQAPGMGTEFAVADVDPVTTRLGTVPVEEAIHQLTTSPTFEVVDGPPMFSRPPLNPCEGVGAAADKLIPAEFHPFVEAVHLAFAEHRPLRLTPDHVWLVLEQGLALHVQANAEALRSRFVEHDGKEKISIRRDDFVLGADNPWHEAIDEFRGEIAKRIGRKHDLFVSDFSTTDAIATTASSVVLMGAMKGYFEYELRSECGIPRIVLEGTTEDWKNIRERVQYMRELDLGDWVENLSPALDAFVMASEGSVDRDFWNSFYKQDNFSGGPFVTGWINLLFPYLVGPSERRRRGRRMRRNQHIANWREGMKRHFGGGPTLDELPPGLSSVPFKWRYLFEHIEMEMLGGFLGIEQDQDGFISPSIGWAVRRETRG